MVWNRTCWGGADEVVIVDNSWTRLTTRAGSPDAGTGSAGSVRLPGTKWSPSWAQPPGWSTPDGQDHTIG
ncbi:hypothetical protein JCM33774_34900 [Actinophytocola sp. KF-1]